MSVEVKKALPGSELMKSRLTGVKTLLRNVNTLGVEKVYVVDPRKVLPGDWQEVRGNKSPSKASASDVKWSFVRSFGRLLISFRKKYFVSLVTSPHVKGANSASLDDVDFTVYSKLVIWFGNESKGISGLEVERSEMCISIPKFGMIESKAK